MIKAPNSSYQERRFRPYDADFADFDCTLALIGHEIRANFHYL